MNTNEAHPITVEVVRNAIVAYADEMANALSRAAYNMMIYEVRDYCCGLLDAQARMISQNRGGLPIFLASRSRTELRATALAASHRATSW
jgi:N-methylhydantoinase B